MSFFSSPLLTVGLPDPFAKVIVDGGQVFETDACKATVDPKWSSHYDLFLARGDGITISIWNQKKVLKNSAGGFMGCVRITASTVQRLKDTGYQRLDLGKATPDDPTPVKGQIIISLLSRDALSGAGNPIAIVGPAGEVHGPDEDENSTTTTTATTNNSEQKHSSNSNSSNLPEGWEERKTMDGRSYFVNHVSRTTQWSRPTQPATAAVGASSGASPQTPVTTTNTNGHHASSESNNNNSNSVNNNNTCTQSATTTTTAVTAPGPSRSATMNNIEQSSSNGSLNMELSPANRRHSTENIIGQATTNGEISNSCSSNSIENNKAASSPTSAVNCAISSPRNSIHVQNVNNLTQHLSSLAIETNSNDSTQQQQTPQHLINPSTPNAAAAATTHVRILNKSTNLSSTQQQQVPPNITAPMNSERSRSPPTNLRNEDNSFSNTPQRSAEVIQNRNATDGE